MDLDDALAEVAAHSGDRLLRVAYQLTHDRVAAQVLPTHLIAARSVRSLHVATHGARIFCGHAGSSRLADFGTASGP